MPRLPRLDLPGIPQHIVQRGNNRLPCFLDDRDREHYLTLLAAALHATAVELHAWVLMDNHVHLLATPPDSGAISQMMQRLGRSYVGQFNARHQRTGTLWEGRYKACLVDSEDYVLRCYRYIELNPVRARMIATPAEYPWSSCAVNVGDRSGTLLTPHPAWMSLGPTDAARHVAYRNLLQEALPEHVIAEIRAYLQQQRALGRDAFRAMIEAKTLRFAATRPAHRPPQSRQPPSQAGK